MAALTSILHVTYIKFLLGTCGKWQRTIPIKSLTTGEKRVLKLVKL